MSAWVHWLWPASPFPDTLWGRTPWRENIEQQLFVSCWVGKRKAQKELRTRCNIPKPSVFYFLQLYSTSESFQNFLKQHHQLGTIFSPNEPVGVSHIATIESYPDATFFIRTSVVGNQELLLIPSQIHRQFVRHLKTWDDWKNISNNTNILITKFDYWNSPERISMWINRQGFIDSSFLDWSVLHLLRCCICYQILCSDSS